MNTSAARQQMRMSRNTNARLRAVIGAAACTAAVALLPFAAPAHATPVRDSVLCAGGCKPAAAAMHGDAAALAHHRDGQRRCALQRRRC
jgi:hypothetical protein